MRLDLPRAQRRLRRVHRRVAQRALDPYRLQCSIRLKETGNTNQGVSPEQRKRDCGIVEIDGAALYLVRQITAERVDIHLQPGRDRRLGTEPRTGASVRRSFDRLVQLEHLPTMPGPRMYRRGRSA